jgi:hypothetical protein
MKTIRKEWPRVRQYVKAGNTYFHVDLRRKHYQGQKWKNFNSRADSDESGHLFQFISDTIPILSDSFRSEATL